MLQNPGLYAEYISHESKDKDIIEIICRDVDRTFPHHVMFREKDGPGYA